MGKFKEQEGQRQVPGGQLAALAPHRLLHVGHQRRPVNAHRVGKRRLHHGYRVGQLRLVRLRVHSPAGLCLRPALPGQPRIDAARVHGPALRAVNAQHAGLVHHRDHPHIVARADPFRRRHNHPPGVRHTDVDVGFHASGHLGVLHHARRTQGRGLHQRVPDGAAHRRIGHTYVHGNIPLGRRLVYGRHSRAGESRHRAVRILETLSAEHGQGLPMAAHPAGLSHIGPVVLVHRPVYGSARAGCKEP